MPGGVHAADAAAQGARRPERGRGAAVLPPALEPSRAPAARLCIGAVRRRRLCGRLLLPDQPDPQCRRRDPAVVPRVPVIEVHLRSAMGSKGRKARLGRCGPPPASFGSAGESLISQRAGTRSA